MSEAARVPFTETKAPESAERLHRGALGLVDISASTMANIGPAYSFYFGFAGIVIAVGLASPLVVARRRYRHRAARQHAVAVLPGAPEHRRLHHLHRQDVRRYQRGDHRAGGRNRLHHRDLLGAGHLRRVPVDHDPVLPGTNVPWIIFSAIFTAGAMFMMFRGVAVSTKLAGFFFAFELAVLLIVSIAVLIKNGGHLSGVPFQPSHVLHGFSGLGLAFPLAIYLFIGWENSAALAEETNNPRRNVPAGRVPVDRLHGGHVPAGRLRHGHRLRLQRQGADGPPHPVHQRRPQRGDLADLHRVPGRADLHPGRAHRRGQLAVPADLQRRPRGPAAALDRLRPPGPPDAGQRHHCLRRPRRGRHPGLGARPLDRRAAATAWTR